MIFRQGGLATPHLGAFEHEKVRSLTVMGGGFWVLYVDKRTIAVCEVGCGVLLGKTMSPQKWLA